MQNQTISNAINALLMRKQEIKILTVEERERARGRERSEEEKLRRKRGALREEILSHISKLCINFRLSWKFDKIIKNLIK